MRQIFGKQESPLAPETAVTAAAKSSSTSMLPRIIPRLLAIASTLASIAVLVTSTQTVVVFGIPFSANYKDTSALRFFLGANIVACSLSVLSLIFVCLQSPLGSWQVRKYFLLFLYDMVTMLLLISGCAAATAIGFVSKYGEMKAGWGAVCGNVPRFCNRSMISLVLAYLAFFCYLGLTIMSANMSRATE